MIIVMSLYELDIKLKNSLIYILHYIFILYVIYYYIE